jgi:succinoglycan biosynthesis transport protein ExoP
MEDHEKLEARGTQDLTAYATTYPERAIVEVAPEDVPHLLDYWQLVMKRRWTVLTCTLVIFATVALGTLKQKPVYKGKVVLEISPEAPQVLNFQQVAQNAPTVDVDSYRETQYKVLVSRSLAETVVNDLRLYTYPEFYRSRWLFGLFQSDPPQIPSKSDPGPPDTTTEAYVNAVSNFQASIDVSPVRRSNLVEVSFYSNDPQLAARIANKLADAYIIANLNVKWTQTELATQFLKSRLGEVKLKLEKAETDLANYARQFSIVFINEKQSEANARLEQLLQQYTTAQADRFQKESQYAAVRQGKIQDLPVVMNNRLIQDLEEKLVDLRNRYADETTWVKPDYPKAVQLRKQIDSLQKQLEEKKQVVTANIVDEYQAAVQKEKFLAEEIEKQKKLISDFEQKGIQYNILKRDVDTYRQLYDGLLERMKEAQVESGLKASNIRVVDQAEVPRRPVKPRILLNLALGLILGLGAGVGLAFFQEYLDKTLKTPDEVERLLRLPSLGVLPRFSLSGSNGHGEAGLVKVGENGHSGLAPAIQTDPTVVEAFRSLRTSILLSASPVPKLIMVTSSLPGEGKSTTAINLGATLASLGSRVVLVDCDMRKPACHRYAGVRNNPGFVQVLTGHAELKDAILPVPGVPNLSIIPCGPIPPNPAEILSSRLAGQLLRQLCNDFEYVLVDSPPLLSVADARILATLTDATVLVTRAFETPYDVVRHARSQLYSVGARVLGVALNDVDFQRNGYGPHSYYHYGYGYGADSSDQESQHDEAT